MKDKMEHYLVAVWPVVLNENLGQTKPALIDLMNISKENGDLFDIGELTRLVLGEKAEVAFSGLI